MLQEPERAPGRKRPPACSNAAENNSHFRTEGSTPRRPMSSQGFRITPWLRNSKPGRRTSAQKSRHAVLVRISSDHR